jgi:hypothetical protein
VIALITFCEMKSSVSNAKVASSMKKAPQNYIGSVTSKGATDVKAQAFNRDRCHNLSHCLRLILFHGSLSRYSRRQRGVRHFRQASQEEEVGGDARQGPAAPAVLRRRRQARPEVHVREGEAEHRRGPKLNAEQVRKQENIFLRHGWNGS